VLIFDVSSYNLGEKIMRLKRKPKVNGLIKYFGLVDWWFSEFNEREREYIDNKYNPMNQRPHTLTEGIYTSIDTDAASFLNGLATWFRNKSDAVILKRIEEKIDDLAVKNPVKGVGYIRGRYLVTYVKDVKELKRAGEYESAEKLLLELVEAVEQVDKKEKCGVAPWYYEELAKIYRKWKDYDREVAVLERFAKQRHGRGVGPKKLIERLEKAKVLGEK
jgi:hypothetical protein